MKEKVLLGFLLSVPMSISFAAPAPYMAQINTMTAKTKTDLHTKYDTSPISKYLSGSSASSQTGTPPSTPSSPNENIPYNSGASSSSESSTNSAPAGSWYVQPGDVNSGSSGSGSSGSSGSGFDYGNIY